MAAIHGNMIDNMSKSLVLGKMSSFTLPINNGSDQPARQDSRCLISIDFMTRTVSYKFEDTDQTVRMCRLNISAVTLLWKIYGFPKYGNRVAFIRHLNCRRRDR